MSLVWGALLFAAGVVCLVGSIERLVDSVVARARLLGVSGLALGVLATSFDPESTAAGVAASLKGLPEIAVGAQVGSAIFVASLALGLLAVAHPFEPDVPPFFMRGAIASALAGALVLMTGRLDRTTGGALLAIFAVLVHGALRELGGARRAGTSAVDHVSPQEAAVMATAAPHEAGRPGPEARESRGRAAFVATVGLSLGGLVLGSELLIEGTQRLLEAAGWSATIFGSVVVAAALSAEEGLLELIPAHKGHPEIAVGNVLGTVAFLLTGSLGLTGVIAPLEVAGSLRWWHPAAAVVSVVAALWVLSRPRVRRIHGALLVGLYAGYVAVSVAVG